MENSQWQPVLSYKHMQRRVTPFKGVIINVTILHGVRSHSRHLLTGRKGDSVGSWGAGGF